MIKTKSTRIRQKEMEQAIIPLKRKVNPKPPTATTLVFTMFGKHDELVNERGKNDDEDGYPLIYGPDADKKSDAFAKTIIGTRTTRYFIKQNGKGKFFNPIGMYEELVHNKQRKHIGQDEWTYTEVNHKVFMYYLAFLKSKNLAHLLNAERSSF